MGKLEREPILARFLPAISICPCFKALKKKLE
jgi:hypothetical protein